MLPSKRLCLRKKVALYNSTSEMVKIQSETNKDMISAADP